ncbi:MAG: hypothetical protein JNM94_18785 [Phycisphaerae bacterium]|nr:hypothetical protein [Phycisphaerae bacterium]
MPDGRAKRQPRWRFRCACGTCRQALLPDQTTCPECGSEREGTEFCVEADAPRDLAPETSAARGCGVVFATLACMLFLLGFVSETLQGRDSGMLVTLVGCMTLVIVSIVILGIGQVVHTEVIKIPAWSERWALEGDAIRIDERRIALADLRSLEFFAMTPAGIPAIDVCVPAEGGTATATERLYLPCDVSLAESAWRCIEARRKARLPDSCNVD